MVLHPYKWLWIFIGCCQRVRFTGALIKACRDK
jgi:hypothetical protein